MFKTYGSSEDRKISSAIAEWVKGKKYDKESDRERVKENSASNVPPFPYPAPMFQNFPFGFPPMSLPGFMGFGQGRGGNKSRNQTPGEKTCFYCKEKGHFVASCPKLKK
jgi:hypothetical protein